MSSSQVASDTTARDRARGALLGLACGDAVGTSVEFAPPGSFQPLSDMVGGGPFGLRPGQWTDDTSMALCVAESIVDLGTLDLADHHRRFIAWRDEGRLSSNGRCFDIGGTCAAELRRFERTGVAVNPDPDPDSAANGSLMRLAPVPIAFHRNVEQAAQTAGESSRSTHAADRPVDACRLAGATVAALVGGASPGEVLDPSFWQWGDLHPEIDAIARGSYRSKEPPEIRGTGFCVDALEAALWAVYGADSFEQAVLRAANLGDDADTTAAIAGQIAGARWGERGIPPHWLDRLTRRERITSLADALFDLEAAGATERWRFDTFLHAWWATPGAVLAGEYPATAAGDTTKLEVLLDAGIRTFVDLTTPDDGLLPYTDALRRLAAERGLDVRHHPYPIPDLGVVDADRYRQILNLIAAETAQARSVYVHCWGGVGRTGTVIGCHLVDGGLGGAEALARLIELRDGTRKARRRCPETDQQTAIVAAWPR